MRSTPGSPREVDLALHSLPPNSVSPPTYGGHQFSSEMGDRGHDPAHIQKRRKREGQYEHAEGIPYFSKYHVDVAKIRQTFAVHSDCLESGHWSKF
jgi:hypothetical protein